MRAISIKPLREYWQQSGNEKLEQPLKTWFSVTEKAEWKHIFDVKKDFPSVDAAYGGYVFDIKGNTCRLLCLIDFVRHGVFVKWIGSHDDYDELLKNDGKLLKLKLGEIR